jgi:uncharacterized protein YndB with AHSA1/START domain
MRGQFLMFKIEDEIVIRRPVEEVFDFVADERNEPRYNPNMHVSEKITDGPIGAGTRFRAEIISRGKPVEMLVEFTAYERPRHLSSVTTMALMEVRGSLAFESVSEGTRMRWSWSVVPRGFLKLITPIAARIGRRQERAIWTGLKRLLEQPKTHSVHA